ncbi:MAG: hypothetical protein QW648_02250 [Nanoarchaeales archaeon]
MIEDELWIVLGIILLIIVGILVYLAITNPKFQELIKNMIWNLKIPKSWKK